MIRNLKLFACVLLCGVSTYAQNILSLKPNDTIAFDPDARIGILPNGFTYYIRHNETAEGMIAIYFVVKAGYNQEEQDQIQLSHVLEHLAFDGTKHFSDPEEYFRRQGIIQNAFTSFNRTVYYLQNIPATDMDLMQDGLLFMKDIGHSLILDSANIESERHVVWNELKGGAGINIYMKDQYMDRVIESPGYARPKIEDAFRNLKEFKHQLLIRFYDDWYSPNNQAIVVVGDVNVDSLERQVSVLFSDMKIKQHSEKKSMYAPFQWKSKVVTATHSEMEDVEVQIIMKRPVQSKQTKSDYSFFLMTELFCSMANARFIKLKESPISPYNLASIQFDNRFNESGPEFGALVTYLHIKKNRIEEGLKQAMVEFERIRQYCFTIKELETAKDEFERINLSVQSLSSNRSIAKQYINHLTLGESYPGPQNERLLFKQLLLETTLEQINQVAKELISDKARDIIIMAPETSKSTLPDEDLVTNWLKGIQSADIGPYEEEQTKKVLVKELMTVEEVANLPKNSTYKQELIESIGVTKLTLSNGAVVLLKPLYGEGLEKDRIYLRALSPGGAMVYPHELDRLSASMASPIVMRSGLNALSQEELNNFKNDKKVSIFFHVLENEEGIWGEAQKNNIEPLLQLTYQYFEHPQKDETIYKDVIEERSAYKKINPSSRIWDSLKNEMGIKSRAKTLTSEDISNVHLDRAYAIYKERFGNAGDFTFALTGDFDLQRTIPLIEQYIGSLSAIDNKDIIQTTSATINNLNTKKVVHEGNSGELARIRLCYAGTYKLNFKNELILDILMNSLEQVLHKRLRKKEGGTYSVSCDVRKNEDGVCYFSCGFQCDPDMIEKMLAYTSEEIEKLRRREIDSETLGAIKEITIAKLRGDLSSPKFWKEYLVNQSKRDHPLTMLKEALTFIQKATPQNLQDAAKKHLSKDRHFELILLPEHISSSFSGRSK